LQWHLLNTGALPGSRAGQDINVVTVWPDYTGKGIRVGVMDDGIDTTHPDLIQNFRADLSWDLFLNASGGGALLEDDNHGTSVSGLVGAAQGNGLGGVGVAWDAQLVLNRTPLTDEDLLLSYQRAVDRLIATDAHISTNSWGPMVTPFDQQENQQAYQAGALKLATEGRDGLGIITLFAAGNSREERLNTNYDAVDNIPWTVVVAAGNIDGTISSYSTPGASLLVTAPGSDPASIVTTDRQGTLGYNMAEGVAGNYTDTSESGFNGTSAATPIAAGVVALMLQANPRLGYRDVQDILVYSSSRAVFLEQAIDQAFNGSTDWNGGALLGSHDFGFGHINAHAAVRLAESRAHQNTVANQVLGQGAVEQAALSVGAGQSAQAVARFDQASRVEQITVSVDLATETLENVTIDLVSPSGSVSRLVDRPPVVEPGEYEDMPSPQLPDQLNYTFSTTRSWGEQLDGVWTLRVANEAGGDTVQINDWSISAYAAAPAATQIFTDEFARFASLHADRTTVRADNGQNLNLAALTTNTEINLSASQASFGGVAVNLADPAAFRDVFTGDGNDTIIGNSAGNLIMAGRGSNIVDGGAGFDIARFIGDRSGYSLGAEGDALVVNSLVLSGGGSDQVRDVELLHFSDQAVLANAPSVQGGLVFDEAAYLRAYDDVAQAINTGHLSSAMQHYQNWGTNEGRNPNDLFNESWYLQRNPDVAAAVAAEQIGSGYAHYMAWGWAEGRSPAAWMNVNAYLTENPDVAQANVNPMAHYLMHGYAEGRALPSWSAEFWAT